MTKEEAIRILYEMLNKTFNGGGELGGLAVQMAVEALRKQEESVSGELDVIAREYAGIPCDAPKDLTYCVLYKKAKYDAVLFGAKWQKEKMMSKAIDVEVKVDAGGYPYIPQMELYDYDKDEPLAKEGDKYKVVLIKKDWV